MTTQESFKKRVRTRMAKTGEKYSAARRALLPPPSSANASAGWVSQPESTDEQVSKATGRTWDEWVAVIDAGPGRDATHTEIAAWLNEHTDIGGWWAQGVTVGYERITGKRLPGQMPDGTFTISRSRTIATPPDALKALIEDDQSRAALLPDVVATRTSKPGVKSPRYALTDAKDGAALGSVLFNFDRATTGTRLTVSHERIATYAATEPWKEFWAQWLTELASAEPPA
ncbi:DUF4287 domain-containing protein [Demequina sp. SO4-13]|uniref:DUF4287 domain-containing protein n=1 Tax=Demequina sp. SO4-13 TaxID=3401027 RepID=UPI003AF533B3